MNVSARWSLPPGVEAAASMRRRLQQECDTLPAALVAEAMLLATELVNNALLHGRGEITVQLFLDASSVRVEVSDRGPGMPTPVERGLRAHGGRGLQIVDTLADDWGVSTPVSGPGKTTWFELHAAD